MRILLLAGGNSSEREVSLDSSLAIYNALIRLGHTVETLDPATGLNLVARGGTLSPEGTTEESGAVCEALAAATFSRAIFSSQYRDFDVVVVGLHGGAGENGVIQSLLSLAGLKYTGSSMVASVIAMNKSVTKQIMISIDVPTPDFLRLTLNADSINEEIIEQIDEMSEYPVIVKPDDGGSTVGLSKVTKREEIAPALAKCARESKNILIEDFVRGRELTVAVLDGAALPVVEIKPKNEFYDYEAKYTKGRSEYIAPAVIPEDVAKAMQSAAVDLYTVVGASGLTRVDFMLTEDEGFYCLELNTLPGMTELSLAPMAAAAVGISFDQLVERIINSAI